jgi:hypothetical protein
MRPLISPTADVDDIEITLTDRGTELIGTVRATAVSHTFLARPSSSCPRTTSSGRRIARAISGRPQRDHSRLTGLPPGEYLIVAIDDALAEGWQDSRVLAQLRTLATRIAASRSGNPHVGAAFERTQAVGSCHRFFTSPRRTAVCNQAIIKTVLSRQTLSWKHRPRDSKTMRLTHTSRTAATAAVFVVAAGIGLAACRRRAGRNAGPRRTGAAGSDTRSDRPAGTGRPRRATARARHRDDSAAACATGTAIIAGYVTTAGSGRPVRRARVTLSGGAARRTIDADE